MVKTVINLKPKILVVSGDLVDDPDDTHLRSAKHELDQLAEAAGAILLEVPGNHDLFPIGIADLRGRVPLHDEIFHSTSLAGGAEQISPGFQPQNRRLLRVLMDRANIFLRRGRPARPTLTADAKLELPRQPTQPPRVETHAGILFALIDSNAIDQYVGAATGRVSEDDLTVLDAMLRETAHNDLARVAVIHHHLLPIAATGGGLVGSEALMVLHNAGDVLGVSARHRFDLVLHGHKHRAQFCRVDLEPETPEGYQIAVAAAGSAAMKAKNDPKLNSFNLITIEDNGRIAVKSYHYGSGGKGPSLEGVHGSEVKSYNESFELVKQRAFIRSTRQHPIIAERRDLQIDVRADGTLLVRDEIIGLRRSRGHQEIVHRPQAMSIPPHGRLARGLALDETSARSGFRIEADPCSDDDPHRKIIVIPEPLNHRPTSYTVTYACANSINMTKWEAAQRAAFKSCEPDFTEWVGGYVSHPVEELVISVHLPPGLANLRPYLRCHRREDFPAFDVSQRGNAELPDTPVRFEEDMLMREEETRGLGYDPDSGHWRVTIRRPIVGYRYRIYWPLPGDQPNEGVFGQTQQWRETLLAMADRVAPSSRDQEARSTFALLAAEFRKRLGSGMNGERANVSLFVYDPERLSVRPVFWESFDHLTPDWRDFNIPLGDGISGASFLQRLVIPWAEHADRGVFVKPVPLAGNVWRTMLAIPVFHSAEQDKEQPSPSATIGIVSFGSSDLDTKIPAFFEPSGEDAKLLRLLRGMTQAIVLKTIEILRRPGP